MGSPRQAKSERIERFQGEVAAAKTLILADFKGLTVGEMEELRRKLREAGGHVRVIKNTLANVALHNLGIEELDGDLGGQIAFVFSDKDAVVGTKVAHEFARRNERFILRGGYFNGRRIGVEELRALATLPSRRELEAGLVGVLAAPLTEFILTLTASLSEFIATLKARAEKLGEVAEAEAA